MIIKQKHFGGLEKHMRKQITISFRSSASAASRLAGLLVRKWSVLFRPRLRSSWIMVFFTYILSMSRQEPPLEFSKPLRLFGRGGSPSIQAMPPAVPFADLPFIVYYASKRGGTGQNKHFSRITAFLIVK